MSPSTRRGKGPRLRKCNTCIKRRWTGCQRTDDGGCTNCTANGVECDTSEAVHQSLQSRKRGLDEISRSTDEVTPPPASVPPAGHTTPQISNATHTAGQYSAVQTSSDMSFSQGVYDVEDPWQGVKDTFNNEMSRWFDASGSPWQDQGYQVPAASTTMQNSLVADTYQWASAPGASLNDHQAHTPRWIAQDKDEESMQMWLNQLDIQEAQGGHHYFDPNDLNNSQGYYDPNQ